MTPPSSRWRRWWPTPESLKGNRWLAWIGPSLYHPRLWRISRRGLALGMAIGIFFGLLIPIAQIPFSAALAVALRANVPAAMASTLVTNPVTFAPVYYLAYQTGQEVLRLLNPDAIEVRPAAAVPAVPPSSTADPNATDGANPPGDLSATGNSWVDGLSGVGLPLVVGLAVFAVLGGVVVYALSSLAWVLHVRLKRRRRLRQAASTTPPPTHPPA